MRDSFPLSARHKSYPVVELRHRSREQKTFRVRALAWTSVLR